jgi:hypothetical protein
MKRLIFVLLLIILAAMTRLLPHPPNFTSVGAVALFSGHTLPRRWAYSIPIIVMLISDHFIGYHALMIPVYAALLVNVFIGERMSRKYALVGAFAGSLIFFITTNFAVWLMYETHSLASLMECYTLAIPFYQYSLSGDLVYTTGLLESYHFQSIDFPHCGRIRKAY